MRPSLEAWAPQTVLLAYPTREMRVKDLAADVVGCLLYAPPDRKMRILEVALRLARGGLHSLPVAVPSRRAHRLRSHVAKRVV